ncbi:hypothetical protein FB45DRAFT_1069562 [Roridomyces roridus]|uniref:AMP-dependent synthetase/ligase domain-containing protein n=1 Tax=Roridomyces roridus TaxID=1738132 RepID=A0AAD7AZ24_9AGAR|nr:hypothetical protein FB45DRAFT_1069562 [Roridomyces roridus]
MANLAHNLAVPFPQSLPYDKQSVAVPGTKRPGQTAHYVNGIWGSMDISTLPLKTLPDVFANGLSGGPNRQYLGYRPVVSTEPLVFAPRYKWYTYGEVDARRRRLGSAIEHLFRTGAVGGGDMETVGIWSTNRPEWQMVDMALHAYKKVGVSLYDTLGKDAVEYIINHAHVTIIFATRDHVSTLLKLASKTPLKLVVSIDPLSADLRRALSEWGATLGVKIMDFAEVEALGEANLIDLIPVTPKDVASLCYTSGTTSMPKGVVLTHENFMATVVGNVMGLELPVGAVVFSYLPLAHIYERVTELITTAIGGSIGFFTDSPLRILEDCAALKPHYFPGVPRVLNRIYQAAMATTAAPGLKGTLFRTALAAKLEKWRRTGDNTHAFWDRLVFSKIAGLLGGRLLFVSSGSAPISRDVVDFLNVAFSCYFTEGWGMTETTGGTTKSWPGDPAACGSVGPPYCTVTFKLIDVPAMNYTSEDKPNARGELCCKGPGVFTVYYKDEKNTQSTIDEEGWMHTGDVAEVDSAGRFKIIDRVKNIMKLAQGEYVALEKVENIYSACPAVAQIYIHGDGLQAYLIAVVVPDPIQLAGIAGKLLGKQVSPEDVGALAAVAGDASVKQYLFKLLSAEAEKNQLKGFERVKRIHVTMNAFTVEDGSLTPTFKIKRKDAYNKFKAELDGLYELGEPKL